jgi:hypothetical protein
MATVSLMPAKADPAWIRAPDVFCPTVGANCRDFVNRSAIGVSVWRFGEGGEHGGAIWDGGSTSFPASYPATVARPYVLLEFTIWQQVFRYNDEIGCFTMRLTVCLNLVSRAPPRRLIKASGVGITVVPWRIKYGVLD